MTDPPQGRAAADRLVAALASMRGATMKLGQLAAFVEVDFLPPADRETYLGWLTQLRSEVRPLEWSAIERVLREEWGERPASILSDVDPEPSAVTSVGQVHRARLDGGGEVAVKVQHPGVEDAFRADMDNLTLVVSLARSILPGLDARATVAELRESILGELDFELAAQAQRAFARAYRGHPFAHVPGVDTELSRRRVLVCDWVDGLTFDQIRERPREERDRFAEILFRFYYGSIFRLGHYNADPHPGNYLLRDDGSVAFLDFGATGRIGRDRAAGLGDVAFAAAGGDAATVHRLLVELGYLAKPGELGAERALEALRATIGWVLAAEPVRIDADLIHATLAPATDVRAAYRDAIRAGRLPAEDLMLQRLAVSVVGVLAQLEAEANWHAIARELWEKDSPATELGLLERDFWVRRGRR